MSICGDCHTPRDRFGAFDMSLYLAGTNDGPDGKPVPNITPDADTGIPKWREGHFVELLQSGMLPDMDNVQGMMAEVIDGYGGGPGYSDAPESELRSIAKYMKACRRCGTRLRLAPRGPAPPGGDLDSERVKGGNDA